MRYFAKKFSIAAMCISAALLLFEGEVVAQCVGVHFNKVWLCDSLKSKVTAEPIGGEAPYTWLWSTGATTQTITVPAGSYKVTLTDASGCLEVKTCVIVQPLCCLWANWTSAPDGCNGLGTGSATIIEIGGGFPPYTIILPNENVKVTNGNQPVTITGLTAGNYIVNITDSKGCTLEQWLEVGQASGPTATINLATISCGQTSTSAMVNATGGTAPYTYLWDNGTKTASAVLTAGPHSVTVTDKNGCTATASVNVKLPQPPNVSLIPTHTTCGEDNGAITATITGGVAPYTCLWSNGSTADNLVSVPAGGYSLTVTGANGCTAIGFTTVLPSTGAQDTLIGAVGCDSVLAYGMVFYQTTTTSFTENVNGCTREVTIHAVVLQTGTTITQNITACYGTVVSVNGIAYTTDATVTTTGTGNCPGQVVWNIEFSEKPDTIPTNPTQVCGFQDTVFSYPVSYQGSNGCTNLVLLKGVQVTKVQQVTAWANPIEQCGLSAKTDTLYKGLMFNPATCILTTTLQQLTTNQLQQEIVWGAEQDTCGIVAAVHEILDDILINQDSCTQLVLKHKLEVNPLQKDTIFSQPEKRCGSKNETVLAFDGDTTANCTQTLFLHEVNFTAWQTTTVILDSQKFCADTSVTLFNFKGRVADEANCIDTIFLSEFVLEQETRDTVWNSPAFACGFVSGEFVTFDSIYNKDCHTTLYLKVLTVYPIATSATTATFCANDSYLWVRNGKVYTEPGIYTDTISTPEGCPDIATLYLSKLPLVYGDTTVFVCHGGFFKYEGKLFGAGTEEEFHFVSNNGCDSTFTLRVVEILNPINITFPGNVTLDLPMMSQEAIDNLVAVTAAGDTINLLGATITEELIKINDSLWLQKWVIITPCDTIERTRTIMVRQPVNPPTTCEVIIQRQPNNIVNIIVSDLGDPQNMRVEVFSANGTYVESNSLVQGFNVLDFNHLSAGGYYLHIYADVMVGNERRPQILYDTHGRYSWCATVAH